MNSNRLVLQKYDVRLRNKYKARLLYNLPLYDARFFGAICGRDQITSLSIYLNFSLRFWIASNYLIRVSTNMCRLKNQVQWVMRHPCEFR